MQWGTVSTKDDNAERLCVRYFFLQQKQLGDEDCSKEGLVKMLFEIED